MNYFFLFYFIIIGIIGIRGIYTTYRFLRYCKEHYPEKASEFLSLGAFTLSIALFKKCDIHDMKYIALKNKAKNAYAGIYIAALVGIFFILILIIIPLVFRS
jgi:hypothetical protein